MPLPVSSSSTKAASSTGPLSPAPRNAAIARKRRGQTTFHVGGTAAVDAAVLDRTAERVPRPALADRHHVGVPEQQQAGPAAARQRDAQVVAARLHRRLDTSSPSSAAAAASTATVAASSPGGFWPSARTSDRVSSTSEVRRSCPARAARRRSRPSVSPSRAGRPRVAAGRPLRGSGRAGWRRSTDAARW